MLSIGKLAPGKHHYYLRSIAEGVEDYYLGAGEAPGRWHGRMAEDLGLSGEVDHGHHGQDHQPNGQFQGGEAALRIAATHPTPPPAHAPRSPRPHGAGVRLLVAVIENVQSGMAGAQAAKRTSAWARTASPSIRQAMLTPPPIVPRSMDMVSAARSSQRPTDSVTRDPARAPSSSAARTTPRP
ncbi:MAG TPA: relaxase domain-containing protein [Acidimicrobiales bacterium]|nr:relaxase domain-containing protein [Acidimicrobiales bacterium]